VATEDKSIAPEIQRNMYKRSNTKVTEIKGSHVLNQIDQTPYYCKANLKRGKNKLVSA